MGGMKEHEDEHSCTLGFCIDMGDEGTALILVACGNDYSSTKRRETSNHTNLIFVVAIKGFMFGLLLLVLIT